MAMLTGGRFIYRGEPVALHDGSFWAVTGFFSQAGLLWADGDGLSLNSMGELQDNGRIGAIALTDIERTVQELRVDRLGAIWVPAIG
jgi:hypothetical protein